MTSIITKSTIESSAYDNVIAFLDNRSIIADPRDPSGYSNRVFIYDTDPLAKSLNFGDFPYIIVEHPTLEYDKSSSDGKTKDLMWSMSITVRTAREGASQGADTDGKKDLFAIGDDLQALFNEDVYKRQFSDLKMHFMKLTKTDFSAPVIDQIYLYQSDYILTFKERLTVSA